MLYVSSGVFLYEYDLAIYSELFTLAIVKCSNAFIISKELFKTADRALHLTVHLIGSIGFNLVVSLSIYWYKYLTFPDFLKPYFNTNIIHYGCFTNFVEACASLH